MCGFLCDWRMGGALGYGRLRTGDCTNTTTAGWFGSVLCITCSGVERFVSASGGVAVSVVVSSAGSGVAAGVMTGGLVSVCVESVDVWMCSVE